MKTLKIASIAAALATLAVMPTLACDYSSGAKNVTASATPAPAVATQAAAATSQPDTQAPVVATTPATTQTAETATVAAPQPKLN